MPKNDFKVPSILLYSTRKTQKLDRTGALKGGTLSDFLTSILLQNNKKSKALWKYWKFFPKKVAKCCKKQRDLLISPVLYVGEKCSTQSFWWHHCWLTGGHANGAGDAHGATHDSDAEVEEETSAALMSTEGTFYSRMNTHSITTTSSDPEFLNTCTSQSSDDVPVGWLKGGVVAPAGTMFLIPLFTLFNPRPQHEIFFYARKNFWGEWRKSISLEKLFRLLQQKNELFGIFLTKKKQKFASGTSWNLIG